MKKILALVLAVVMMAALSVCAFAKDSDIAFYGDKTLSGRFVTFSEELVGTKLTQEYLDQSVSDLMGLVEYLHLEYDGSFKGEKTWDEFLSLAKGYLGSLVDVALVVDEHMKNNETAIGFWVDDVFVGVGDLIPTPQKNVAIAWSSDFEEDTVAEVKDAIDGSGVNFAPAAESKTEEAKANVGTGSTVAPVVALSALVVLAGAAVVASKKR